MPGFARTLVLIAGLSIPSASAMAEAQWPVGQMALPAPAVSLASDSEALVLRLADGTAWSVGWNQAEVKPILQPAEPIAPEAAPGLIPHGRVARGAGEIRRAWLADPTERYPHAILGDRYEAATLLVETADGRILGAAAPEQSVFEDLEPRLWDLDQDGSPEVWVIRSDAQHGAGLEAYTIQAGKLSRRYGTPPIGMGFRWLNPIGVADFVGDGTRQLALVITPHIGGILTLYRLEGDRLEPILAAGGYSNHAVGSTQLGLSWIGDIDGDGLADILLPEQNRQTLAAVSLAGGAISRLAETERFGPLRTGLAVLTLPDGSRAAVFADDGPGLRWLRLPPPP